jgi:hypothetical protein
VAFGGIFVLGGLMDLQQSSEPGWKPWAALLLGGSLWALIIVGIVRYIVATPGKREQMISITKVPFPGFKDNAPWWLHVAIVIALLVSAYIGYFRHGG